MEIRIYPRCRYYAIPEVNIKWDCGKWNLIPLKVMLKELQWWFPQAEWKIEDDHIIQGEKFIDKELRQRYFVCYDHTIRIDGKWRSGFDKKGNMIYQNG